MSRPVSEMQERIARAIYGIFYERGFWETESEDLRDLYRRRALAAMKAMREPTLDAIDAGERAYRAARTHGVSGMTIEAQTRAECARFSAGWKAALDAEISIAEGGKHDL